MGGTEIDRRTVERRTQLAALAGLRLVPLAALLALFAVGELGWHLGAWFLPTLAVAALAVIPATLAAVVWHRSRIGRVRAHIQWRSLALLGVLLLAYAVSAWTDLGPQSPVFVNGVLLGALIAALAWGQPYACAHHLAVGLVLAVLSAVPLGAIVDVPLPPGAADLPEPVHPLAAYERFILPAWLLLSGVVEHLRQLRVRQQPVAAAGT